MSEANFFIELRTNCESISFYRVENKIDAGTPDVHYITTYGTTGWLELKYIRTEKTRVKMQAAQPIWLRQYERLSGCCMVLIKVGDNRIVAVSAKHSRQLQQGVHVDNIKLLCDFSGEFKYQALQRWLLIRTNDVAERIIDAYRF